MAQLVYTGIMSVDGYIADKDGKFDWSAPDDEVHAFVNDREASIGTYLYGRRMYEVMRYWETAHTLAGQSAVTRDFTEIWQAADKIVYSTTLEAVSTERTRLERSFDPAEVRRSTDAADRDVGVGGAALAAHAIRAGIVDEFHMYVTPHIVGGGTPYLPDDVRLELELLDEHRFTNGVVYLRYRVR
ncbi:dihydrofolate reductase family protein [Antrihabitans cavernicola]|uniref:Deaminase n=1 Tax=Antrihabitans cavernicola TaxID=2495913 RepID=A0A5A7S7F0_9NOCA|nr:dihydrofolate reductase family protein [Spelaeibacter cavernicola]KAA0021424.1 deaminase [Spelaeibacter cavernicola]